MRRDGSIMGPQKSPGRWPSSRTRPANPARRAWTWYLAQRRVVQALIAALLLVGVYAAVSLGRGSISNNPQTQRHATPTALGPKLLTGAVLRGPLRAFDVAYGSPIFTTPSQDSDTYLATVDRHRLFIEVHLDTGTDIRRVGSIHIGPAAEAGDWDAATAAAMIPRFLPTDAKYQQTLHVPKGGEEQIYVSPSLALSFPALAFSDAQTHKQVRAGTYYYLCDHQNVPQGGCVAQVGQ